MADKPSKALVLFGDGLARFIDPTHTHLHAFATRACCGFLTVPHSPPSENEDIRILRELAELLDSNEAPIPTVAERFMGMKAALITNNSSLNSIGDKLGITILNWNDLVNNQSGTEFPSIASELLRLLGIEEGKTLDASEFDLVFVHVGANEMINNYKDTEILNNLVGELVKIAKPGSDTSSRLLVSLIMSYGATIGDDHSKFSVPEPKYNGELSLVIPRQSYMMKGGKPRENVRQYCPMLLAQYQNAVTRKDMVKTFSFSDFVENAANLVIPADRFLHEVAFKLWKAPKYGA